MKNGRWFTHRYPQLGERTSNRRHSLSLSRSDIAPDRAAIATPPLNQEMAPFNTSDPVVDLPGNDKTHPVYR